LGVLAVPGVVMSELSLDKPATMLEHLEEARALARSAAKRAVTSGPNSVWVEWAIAEYPWLADEELREYLAKAQRREYEARALATCWGRHDWERDCW